MHKMNRIGRGPVSAFARANTTPAIGYTGVSLANPDINHYQLNGTNFGEQGGTVDATPTGTFTFTTATKMGFGMMTEIDVPFADTIALELWADAYFALSQGAFLFGYAGQITRAGAFPIAASITNVQDVVVFDVQQPQVAASAAAGGRMHAIRGEVNMRRTDALPFRIAFGIGIANPAADVASCALRHMSIGYRTLADQYAFNYYDPAR